MKEGKPIEAFCVHSKARHVVIIGNGIAGVTCARHLRKRDSTSRITIISGETEHFFSRTALMYIYMGHMKFEHTKPYEDWFWEKNRLSLVHDWVTHIDFDKKELQLKTQDPLAYDILVLALGSQSNMFGWPGQDLKGVQGLYSYQDLENMEASTKTCQKAVVVGGGLIGIEMAEMLRSRNIPVTFLVREQAFWDNVLPPQEAELVGRHIREHHFDLRLGAELDKIIDDGTGQVKAVVTKDGEEIACQFVGLTVGVSPNIGLVRDTQLGINKGILVDEHFATNIPNVFAIGDCAEYRTPPPLRRPVEQVWYTGRMHGETLAHNLTQGPVPYQPGPWFNSAKFLDIEYQTYGLVPNKWEEPVVSFYWEHPDGKKCLRLLFDKNRRQLQGVNVFGMRLRHAFFDKALRRNVTVEEVIGKLQEANFDPEFYDRHYAEILQRFNQQFGTSLQLQKEKKRKSLWALLGL
ncbi:NAD(P)/FAD-dependent oxidoreductase [Pontibacter sp. JH31]|uniref:NAD(P)/FAD-dependent oxidoreductase n=1 Tax=Pontibacter aquaedesilientis TaxID=2766980 RepID=A0ABR7XEX6_9BACT|nr:FAD/NAD(P)-binding oxidoreductase [Pontibacter aquaedesilientis]MBD1396846.1 NAD(P)/FAD-dependent oxidoreductase [Pontibacter aquaedesilientis]